jgi:prepilin-type processing-associated H-X9-DG protein
LKKTEKSGQGYTLTELLVVIGTVAVLAAILLPVVANSALARHRYTSGENLNLVGKAVLQYLEDNDGKYPRAGYSCRNHLDTVPGDNTLFAAGEANQCGGDEWQDAVGPYVHDKRIFLDSADYSEVGEGPWGGGTDTTGTTTDGNLSFIINDLLSHQTPTSAKGYADVARQDLHSNGLRISDVKTPSQCLLLAEGHSGWDKASASDAHPVLTDWTGSTDIQNKWHHDYSLGNCSFLLTSTAYDGMQFVRVDLPFHRDGANMFYADGHAAFVVLQDKTGKPLLCKNLPWTKNVDPKQRHAERNSCRDSDNPLPGGWTNPNWY